MLPSAIWLIALIVLVVGEAVTVGLTFVWFAVGALGGLLTAVLGGPIWLQIVVFLGLSAVSLILIRPAATRFLKTSRSPTNADRVIGQTAIVTQSIDNIEGKGQVNIAGQIWSARSQEGIVIPEGTEVTVLRIEGVKVFVCKK
ncbi:MAG: NfeD family protein [Lawsonibacter sp.]|jgi:membrane protein implicated in regulation of membrane protease activity